MGGMRKRNNGNKGKEEGIKDGGDRGIFFGRDLAKNAVKRIAESRKDAVKESDSREADRGGQANHDRSAKGNTERQKAEEGIFLLKENWRKEKHPEGRGIHQDARDRERILLDRIHIANVKKHEAADARTDKDPYVTRTDPKRLRIFDQKEAENKQHGKKGADGHRLHGRKARLSKSAGKKPDAPPYQRGNQNRHNTKISTNQFFHISSHANSHHIVS